MPKVKFTALVSDMKGKANGSVFSSNKGGSYFRTNKSGGGRKTESWAVQKSSFADLSSTWKKLTEEQQQAWKDATTNYPTTNAFGDLRYPTGYELYMRINGTLKAAGQFLLDVPETPREMPVYTPLQIIVPEEYLFTPRTGFRFVNPSIGTFRLQNPDYNNGASWYEPFTYSMRFIFDNNNRPNFYNGAVYELASISQLNQGVLLIFLEIVDTYIFKIWVTSVGQDDDGDPLTFCTVSDFNRDILTNELHLSVNYNADALSKIYVNGCLNDASIFIAKETLSNIPSDIIQASIKISPSEPYTFVSTEDNRLVLGARSIIGPTYVMPSILSDFRVYATHDIEEGCSNNNPCPEGFQCYGGICSVPSTNDYLFVPANIGKIYRGHILTTEIYAIGCYEFGGGSTPNYCSATGSGTFYVCKDSNVNGCDNCTGNDFECIDGVCTYIGDSRNIVTANPLTYAPLIVVKNVYIDGENYAAQLSWTGLISNGKSLEQVPYKLLATLPISENSINISTLLLARAGNFSGEAAWGFRAFLLDTYTGQRYASQMTISAGARKKRPPGFKAGAELSGKVN